MNKGVFCTILCCSILAGIFAQTVNDYNHPDAIARTAPDSVEKAIVTLSDYFNANLNSEKELIRAFYYWTANEIVYDFENMFNYQASYDPARVISETLGKRKAVCQGYAGVFHELCENAGIESYIVFGYTKQKEQVVNINHAWLVARIDSAWYFFDPTWGSGYILNGQFTRKFTNEYFMVDPSDLIKSHMPFDPLWQCLYYPFSTGDFIKGMPPEKKNLNYFNYPDSIDVYNRLPKPEKLAASLRRIEKNGVENNVVSEYMKYLNRSLEIERMNRQNERQNDLVNRFNEAVNLYNTAAILFNDYINYWNHQFNPIRRDAEIRQMLDTCNILLSQSRSIIDDIIPQEETLRKNIEMLAKPLKDIQKKVNQHKKFLTEYLRTSKALRPGLFRKYTWLGE
jgi:hypothetical protein